MRSVPSWINLGSTQQDELGSQLPPLGSWCLLAGTQLPSVFPTTLRDKIGLALAIAAPTSTGGTYLVYSAHRVDRPAKAIDIEPFGLIVHSTGPSASGVYLHHGSWGGRTYYPPRDFWNDVAQSGVGGYYMTQSPANLRSGTLDQLPKGNLNAFDAVATSAET